MKKVIYLDNAATTKVRPEVVEAMLPFYITETLLRYMSFPHRVRKPSQKQERLQQTLSARRTMRSTSQMAVPSPTTGL